MPITRLAARDTHSSMTAAWELSGKGGSGTLGQYRRYHHHPVAANHATWTPSRTFTLDGVGMSNPPMPDLVFMLA